MKVYKLLLFMGRHGKVEWRSCPSSWFFVKESGGVTGTCLIAFEISKITWDKKCLFSVLIICFGLIAVTVCAQTPQKSWLLADVIDRGMFSLCVLKRLNYLCCHCTFINLSLDIKLASINCMSSLLYEAKEGALRWLWSVHMAEAEAGIQAEGALPGSP